MFASAERTEEVKMKKISVDAIKCTTDEECKGPCLFFHWTKYRCESGRCACGN